MRPERLEHLGWEGGGAWGASKCEQRVVVDMVRLGGRTCMVAGLAWIQRINWAICLADRIEQMLPISLSSNSFFPETRCPSLGWEERKE